MSLDRREVEFLLNEDALSTSIAGIPLSEAITQMEVSNCVQCGREAADVYGGVLHNLRIEHGVLKGDSVCSDCLPSYDPEFQPPEGFFDGANT